MRFGLNFHWAYDDVYIFNVIVNTSSATHIKYCCNMPKKYDPQITWVESRKTLSTTTSFKQFQLNTHGFHLIYSTNTRRRRRRRVKRKKKTHTKEIKCRRKSWANHVHAIPIGWANIHTFVSCFLIVVLGTSWDIFFWYFKLNEIEFVC